MKPTSGAGLELEGRIGFAADYHPDPLVRQSATAMMRDYTEAVIIASMTAEVPSSIPEAEA